MPACPPSVPVRDPSPTVSRRPPGLLVYAQLGLMGALWVLGLGALGWFLDSEAGTLPLFLFCGLLAGAAVAALYTWREVKKYM